MTQGTLGRVPELSDLSCVVHLHSIYSDGTGTVPEIAKAAEQAGADVVLLTDHDTIEARRRGDEGRHGPVLVLVGHEVSPRNRNHMLAFDTAEAIRHEGLNPAQIADAVRAAGGLGIAAHPFSEGSERFGRFRSLGTSMRWEDLECLDGIEVWSFLSDNGQNVASVREALRFIVRPERYVTHPPQRNLDEWDRLGARRRVVGIGGLDAHQFGRRIGGRVIRVMGYARSFRQLRTHVLIDEPMRGDLPHDGAQVYAALREGRCYIAAHSVAPAGGFRFCAIAPGAELAMGGEARVDAGGWDLQVSLPQSAAIRLLRNGREVAGADAATLEHRARGAGVYRVEARLESHGALRTWILSNPIYLR
jgi:hypothetical protein